MLIWYWIHGKNFIVSKLESLPTGHSHRIIPMRLPFQSKQQLTLSSVYASTLLAASADKYRLYSRLRSVLNQIPNDYNIRILSDFNARIRKSFEAWKVVLGQHRVGHCKNNEHLLIEFCTEYQLSITTSLLFSTNDR